MFRKHIAIAMIPTTAIIAQTTGQALDTLESSVELSQKTTEAWGAIWSQTIFRYQEASLWFALVELGMIIAGISVVYLAVTEGREAIEKQSWSQLATMFIWPLVVVIFLSGNGAVLSQSVKFVYLVGRQNVQQVLVVQVGDLQIKEALAQITLSSAARNQIEALNNECISKQDEELTQCLQENGQKAQDIVNQAENQNNGPLEKLREFAGEFVGSLSDFSEGGTSAVVFRSIAIPLIRWILGAMQWAFVNMLEAALLLTAAFAPVAMGLSLLPFQGRPIFAWLIGFASLFGVQLGYNIIVGVAAIVIVNSGGELITDVGFLFLLAVFAPMLAIAVSSFGGIAIYRAVSRGTQTIINTGSTVISSAAQGIAKSTMS